MFEFLPDGDHERSSFYLHSKCSYILTVSSIFSAKFLAFFVMKQNVATVLNMNGHIFFFQEEEDDQLSAAGLHIEYHGNSIQDILTDEVQYDRHSC